MSFRATFDEEPPIGLYVPVEEEPAVAANVPYTAGVFVDPNVTTLTAEDFMDVDNIPHHPGEYPDPEDLFNLDNLRSSDNSTGSNLQTSLEITIPSLGKAVVPGNPNVPDNSGVSTNWVIPDTSNNPDTLIIPDNAGNPDNADILDMFLIPDIFSNPDTSIIPDNAGNPETSIITDNAGSLETSAVEPAIGLQEVAVPSTTPDPMVFYTPPKVQLMQSNSWQLGPRSSWDDYQPSYFPVSSAGHRLESFSIKFDYRPLPPSPSLREPKAAKMYVEKYTPREPKWAYPIVLVHGDYHTGKIWTTKPDGAQGWAAFFINKGFTVYIVDLPACGRSIEFDQSIVKWSQYASCTARLTRGTAEATRTAASLYNGWPDAHKHNQWPGSGLAGEPIFETYMASTVPLYFRRHERQAIGKEALTRLVQHTGPAILLGEGSGATLSYLAADALPDSVKAVLAVEPAGPPGGTTSALKDTFIAFNNQVRYFAQHRAYGLSDIPLTFDPPVAEPVYDEYGVTQPPLDLFATAAPNNAVYLLQRGGPELLQADTTGRVLLPWEARPGVLRKLVSLSKVCQLVVTGEASHHTTCDAATVSFMRQAGVDVDHVQLGEVGVCGNGHLMFLERNSDAVAQIIFNWVATRVPGVQRAAAEGSSAAE